MTTIYTAGRWRAAPGRSDAFVEAWGAFAEWASSMPGAGTLRLTRSDGDGRFVSFGDWEGTDAVRAWKAHPEFRERLARVLQYVDEFEPAELAVLATKRGGDHAAATG